MYILPLVALVVPQTPDEVVQRFLEPKRGWTSARPTGKNGGVEVRAHDGNGRNRQYMACSWVDSVVRFEGDLEVARGCGCGWSIPAEELRCWLGIWVVAGIRSAVKVRVGRRVKRSQGHVCCEYYGCIQERIRIRIQAFPPRSAQIVALDSQGCGRGRWDVVQVELVPAGTSLHSRRRTAWVLRSRL